MSARYRTELEADGRRSEGYTAGTSPEDAAQQAVKGWRSDASLHGEPESGEDLYGAYTRYAFRAGSRWAAVIIRPPYGEEGQA